MTPPTIFDADAYFAKRMFTEDWDTSIAATKTKALAHAATLIDRHCIYTDPIPTQLIEAVFEIALELISGNSPEAERADLQRTSASIASVRSTYDRETLPEYILAGIPSGTAWQLMLPFMQDRNSIRIVKA